MGCRLNTAEMEHLARQFVGLGHEVISEPVQADVIVLNSCAVTAQAARKSRHRLRTLRRENPRADVAVTGCWATESPDRARQIEGVRWVVPNADKRDAVAAIVAGVLPPKLAPWAPGRWGHTRAFLGVQDGCDHACTFCVTRLLRGPVRSRPPEETVGAVREFVTHGAREVILTGVSLGAYGRDLGMDDGLAMLARRILAETDLHRLRLSSIEPWDVSAALLRLLTEGRLCRQLHLPLQSGSDAVLRRMGRRTTAGAYLDLVAAARDISPDIAITTDIIVGFPGETEADYAATVDLVEACGFARLHVFPYSERAGTPAARLPDAVDVAQRKARAHHLRVLGRHLAAAYRARFIDDVMPVLWEPRSRDGRWVGWTDNYIEVRTEDSRDLYNTITPTRLVRAERDYVVGKVPLG